MHVSGGMNVVIKYAKLLRNAAKGSALAGLAEKPIPTLVISSADLVQVVAKDVRFTPEDLGGEDRADFGFDTDAGISRARGGG